MSHIYLTGINWTSLWINEKKKKKKKKKKKPIWRSGWFVIEACAKDTAKFIICLNSVRD